MLRYGKVESIKQLISAYLSKKTIISINNEELMYNISGIDEIEEINSNVFLVNIYAFDKKYKIKNLKMKLSFNDQIEGDNIIICSFFNDMFPNNNPVPEYGDIIDIESFSNAVESRMFTNNDGSGYILLKDGTFIDDHYLGVQDLASLKYHPNVKSIIWFNK